MKIQIILVLLILDKRIDFNFLINAKTLFALTGFKFIESKTSDQDCENQWTKSYPKRNI